MASTEPDPEPPTVTAKKPESTAPEAATLLRVEYAKTNGLFADHHPGPAFVGDLVASMYVYPAPHPPQVFVGTVQKKYDDDTYRLEFGPQHDYGASTETVSRAAFHVYARAAWRAMADVPMDAAAAETTALVAQGDDGGGDDDNA